MTTTMLVKDAEAIVGGLSAPGKMPCPSWSTPAQECNVGSKLRVVPGTVCSGCYALKGNYTRYPMVAVAQYRRLAAIDNPLWTKAMATLSGRLDYFRWFDAGDIRDMSHLQKIVAVAMLTPQTQHWLPTKEYGLIASYRRRGGYEPPNLVIRLSAPRIGGVMPPSIGPSSMVVSEHGKATPGAFLCGASSRQGKCGPCRACWHPENRTIAYPYH
jgi:hypothetical protein